MKIDIKVSFISTIVLFLAFVNQGISQNLEWHQTNGPSGNYIADIALGKSDEIYAATSGGIYISMDDGNTWKRRGLFEHNIVKIESIIDDNLIAITAKEQIFLSQDYGLSWAAKGKAYYAHGLAIHPSGSIYFIRLFEIRGSPRGLFVSKDYGLSWKNISTGYDIPNDIEVNSNGDILFITERNEIYLSINQDSNWKRIFSGPEREHLELDVTTNSHGAIYGIYEDTLIISTNTGLNWSKKWINIPDAKFLHPTVDDNGNIYVIMEGWPGSTYISQDEGKSWSKINSSLAGEYTRIFNIHPLKSNWSLISTSNGIFKVEDSIESKVEINIPNSTIYSLAATSSGNILASTSFGLYRSKDLGDSWQYFGESRSLSGVLEVSSEGTFFAERAYEGSSDLYYSKDGGISWKNSQLNVGSWITGLISDQSGKIFASSPEGVWHSHREKLNWSKALPDKSGQIEYGINCIAVSDRGNTLYIGRQKGIEKHEFAGKYFNITSKGLEKEYVNSIIINKKGDVFAGTKRGIFRSDNQGKSWTRLDKDFNDTDVFRTWTIGDPGVDVNMWLDLKGVISFHIDKTGNIYAGTYKNGIYMSSDNGNTWMEINSGIGKSTVHAITSDSEENIYAGTKGAGVYRLRIVPKRTP